MITKERLEELIEQGATIYSTHWKEEVDLSQKCEIVKKSFCDGKKRLVLIVHEDEEHSPYYMLENLTEDVEGAKWKEEFGCIERTERLELPTWEEVSKDFIPLKVASGQYPVVEFGDNSIEIIVNENKDIQVVLWADFVGNFVAPLTKENYIKACRKAKELFLGENK